MSYWRTRSAGRDTIETTARWVQQQAELRGLSLHDYVEGRVSLSVAVPVIDCAPPKRTKDWHWLASWLAEWQSRSLPAKGVAMSFPLDRRSFLIGSSASMIFPPGASAARSDWYIGKIPDRPFDIQLVDKKRIPERFHRQSVPYSGPETTGTILINKQERMLYYIDRPSSAIRFGIAVGRDGRRWSGEAIIARRAKWPGWTPTANMRRRDPSLPSHVPGGPRNPLGARALYLYRDGRDTLYRIHGTHEPWSIGQFASSGCIRMLNEHVFELFGTVRDGARVVVL